MSAHTCTQYTHTQGMWLKSRRHLPFYILEILIPGTSQVPISMGAQFLYAKCLVFCDNLDKPCSIYTVKLFLGKL